MWMVYKWIWIVTWLDCELDLVYMFSYILLFMGIISLVCADYKFLGYVHDANWRLVDLECLVKINRLCDL